MDSFRLAESFVSINGEGQHAGELALFLRFTGCNLSCSWCDTKWVNPPDALHRVVTLDELLQTAKKAFDDGVKNVTLTGGEPLLQKNICVLIKGLCALGMRVEIETNGSVAFSDNVMKSGAEFTMDYKLPSSGMESRMCLDNLPKLRDCDTLKFVCGSAEDLERAAKVIEDYRPKGKIYLSPVFGMIEPADMVEFMKERKLGEVRLQLQLHKFIWDPNARGV